MISQISVAPKRADGWNDLGEAMTSHYIQSVKSFSDVS